MAPRRIVVNRKRECGQPVSQMRQSAQVDISMRILRNAAFNPNARLAADECGLPFCRTYATTYAARGKSSYPSLIGAIPSARDAEMHRVHRQASMPDEAWLHRAR